jgi:hypothetical protein
VTSSQASPARVRAGALGPFARARAAIARGGALRCQVGLVCDELARAGLCSGRAGDQHRVQLRPQLHLWKHRRDRRKGAAVERPQRGQVVQRGKVRRRGRRRCGLASAGARRCGLPRSPPQAASVVAAQPAAAAGWSWQPLVEHLRGHSVLAPWRNIAPPVELGWLPS